MSDTCFVIMPYGRKKDVDGNEVDFDEIYKYIIEKAIEKIPGLQCQRCDDIALPGWIHERMIRHIFEDRVAIVDTSTLNANVFYELGVRHALKRCVTVLIHRKGTTWPFNIAGMSSIEYTTNPSGVEDAKEKISTFVNNALKDPKNVDSLVYSVLPELEVEVGPAPKPKRLSKVETVEYSLVKCPQKRIGLVTGDREELTIGDIWVNSENSEMQMDRFYGTTTSANIRYLGAKKQPTTGRVVEDTIADELARKMGAEKQVDPATVIPTSAGELQSNNVKWIFHVAAVVGEPREGYRPIERIERCVTNALKKADSKEFREEHLSSIIFPIFGTGPAGGSVEEHAERCFTAAIDYLESNPTTSMERVYFYVWSDQELEICEEVLGSIEKLGRVAAPAK